MNGAEVRVRRLNSVQTQNLFDLSIDGNTVGAGTALISSGTLTLVGGPNITLSQDGGNVITVSGAAGAGGSFSAGISSLGNTLGTTGTVSGQVVLVGGTNITLSQSIDAGGVSATITISGNDPTFLGVSSLGNSAGTTGLANDRIVFVGGSNISLSESIDALSKSATITIDASLSQSTQSYNILAAGSQTGNTTGTIVFSNSNNVSFGMSNNSVVTATATISQSVQTGSIVQAVVITGNTSGTTASISSGTLNLLGGYGITLSQNLNSIEISGGEQLTAVVSNLGNTAGTTGAPAKMDQLIFVGGNNITLSQSFLAEDVTITISGANQSVQTQGFIQAASLVGTHTSGTLGVITSGTLYLSGGQNITLSQNANTVEISAQSQSVQISSIVNAVIIGGNTSGTTASISSGTLVLAGDYGITLSQVANTISISGGEQLTAVVSNLGNTAGTTGAPAKMDQLIFVGGNNITLSQSFLAEDVTITISGANQSVQTQSRFNLTISGNTTGTGALISSGVLTLVGGNAITVSQAGGNAITISAQPMLSAGVSSLGNTLGSTGVISDQLVFVGGNNITLSQSTNLQSATITISSPNMFSAGESNLGNTLGTSGPVSQLLVLVGGNNVTLSQSADALSKSATLTISAFNQTTQTSNIINAVSLSAGNTAGTSALISSGTMYLAGGNSITLSQNGNSITISGATTSQSLQTSNLFDLTISGNTAGTSVLVSSGTLTLAGGNNITLSQVGNAITISAGTAAGATFSAGVSSLGNSAGTTGVVTDRLVFVGSDNITLSQSINGQSATITIVGATVAGGSFSAGISGGNVAGDTGTVQNRVVFAGGNNITLSGSTNAGSMTITVSAFNQTLQTSNLFDLTISGNTSGTGALISSGTLTLVGGNQITLSQAGGNAITISASQSIQTGSIINGVSLSGTNTSGTLALISSGTMYLAGGNDLVLSQVGNSITFSVTGPLSAGMSAGIGNTSGTAGVVHDQLVIAGGNNITLSQSVNLQSATLTISSPNMFSAGVSTGGNSLGTTGPVSQLLVFVGGNNITLSESSVAGGSGTITISGASQSVQLSSIVNAVIISSAAGGSTTGTTASISSGTLNLVAGNNVTLSQAGGNAITISGANQTLQTSNLFDLTISGNTTGTGALISSGTLSLAGGNNITLSQAGGNAITISGGNSYSAGMSNLGNVSAGATTGLVSQQLVIAGGANITLNQSIGTGTAVGQATLSIVAASQTTQTSNIINAVIISSAAGGSTTGTTASITSGTMNLVAGNNITLSQAAGNAITISGASQSIQTQSTHVIVVSGNTTGTTASMSTGSISIAGGNSITLSQAAGNAFTISGPQFSNSNNFTFGANAGTITASFSESIQTQSRFNLQISGNTTGTSILVSSGVMTLAGGNSITLSQGNNNAITISGPQFSNSNNISFGANAGTITATASFAQSTQTQNLHALVVSNNTSGATTIGTSGTVSFAGTNITITANTANNSIIGFSVASPVGAGIGAIGNTASSNAFTSGTVQFSGLANITVNTSVNGASQYIQISAPAAGGASTLKFWENVRARPQTILTLDLNGSMNFQRIFIPYNVSATQIDFVGNITATSNLAAGTLMISVGLYTFNASSASSVSSAQFSTTLNASGQTASIYGSRWRTGAVNWNITPGEYLFAFNCSQTGGFSGSFGGAHGLTNLSNFSGGGAYSRYFYDGILTATTGAMPTSIHLSDIDHTATVAVRRAYWFDLIGTL